VICLLYVDLILKYYCLLKSIENVLPESYGNCTDGIENDARVNGYILKYPVNYSRDVGNCFNSSFKKEAYNVTVMRICKA